MFKNAHLSIINIKINFNKQCIFKVSETFTFQKLNYLAIVIVQNLNTIFVLQRLDIRKYHNIIELISVNE